MSSSSSMAIDLPAIIPTLATHASELPARRRAQYWLSWHAVRYRRPPDDAPNGQDVRTGKKSDDQVAGGLGFEPRFSERERVPAAGLISKAIFLDCSLSASCGIKRLRRVSRLWVCTGRGRRSLLRGR